MRNGKYTLNYPFFGVYHVLILYVGGTFVMVILGEQ